MSEGPVFWVWALFFSAVVGVGLYLMFPTGRLTGAILTIAGMLGLFALVNPDAIQAPRLVLYGPAAVAASAAIAAGMEFLKDRDLKARLVALHSSLSDFALDVVEQAAKLDALKGSESKVPELDRWIDAQFTSRYQKRLTEIFRETVERGWFDGTLAAKLLRLPFRGEGPTYWIGGTKIGVVAGFINGVCSNRLRPSEWLRRPSFWRTLVICLFSAAAIWGALGIRPHHWPIWR
ncbi:MAG TPA: hypothetical protein VNF28_01995 [Candidatus Binataceae bacterium]|nr:hypothetical protein [Candidatus Binataceae bacterium]